MLPSTDIRIRQILRPEVFDDAAAQVLGEVAALVCRSREEIWGTGDLCNAAEDIYRDLHDPWERVVLLGAYVQERLVGRAEVRLPLVVDTRRAQVQLTVDPGSEAVGVGAELLAAAEQLAGSEARRHMTIHTEHPGPGDLVGDGRIGSPTGPVPSLDPQDWLTAEDGSGRLPLTNRQTRFAHRAGYRLRTVSDISRLRVPLAEQERARLLAEAAAHDPSDRYRTHVWQDAAPDRWLDSLARLHERMPSDAFVGPEVWDPEPWDAARVRRTEQLRTEGGDLSFMAAVEHRASGELVGMTELVLPEPDAVTAFQDETVVLREHRGRRLGLRLKLANLGQLAQRAPGVRSVYVWTHSGNAQMNRVNRRLGAQVVGRSGVWDRGIGAA